MTFVPRPYQEEALAALNQHICEKDTNPCVVIPTGGGKSALMAWSILKWKEQAPWFRVCILAHRKELVRQNAEELHDFVPNADIGIYAAGLGRRNASASITFAMIDSIYKKSGEFTPFDVLFIDECFPAGTKVSTPRGDIPIEDLCVGQTVHNALGIGKIEATSAHNVRGLIKLELNNGTTIKCTPNHPFFTEHGWRKAETLAIGSYLFSREDMRMLRSHISAMDGTRAKRENTRKKLCERMSLEKAAILLRLLREKVKNPMWNQGAREKMRKTLKEIKHKPILRGGNGKLTHQQVRLQKALGTGWMTEIVVITGKQRPEGAPHCYKIDVANEAKKIAIELDGNSHGTAKIRDADRKKTQFLLQQGWRVFHLSNAKSTHLCTTCKSADTLLTTLMTF